MGWERRFCRCPTCRCGYPLLRRCGHGKPSLAGVLYWLGEQLGVRMRFETRLLCRKSQFENPSHLRLKWGVEVDEVRCENACICSVLWPGAAVQEWEVSLLTRSARTEHALNSGGRFGLTVTGTCHDPIQFRPHSALRHLPRHHRRQPDLSQVSQTTQHFVLPSIFLFSYFFQTSI